MDYDKYLSKTALEMKPSGIRKYFDIAASMPDSISLGVGEPNFVTPRAGIDAAIKSMEDGITRYTSNSGLLQLRESISRFLFERYELGYSAENEIIVTVGASEAIDIALLALLNPGDEVLVAEPCFVSYSPTVRLAGGVPVVLNCTADNGFIVTADMIEKSVSPKTKAILLCYPNNPTGAIMTKKELLDITSTIIKHDLMVISDEIYSELTYGEESHTSIASLPGMRERTIVINGFSKWLAMTGWRLGFLAAPKPLAKQALKIHQYKIMCAPTAAQYAAHALLEEGFQNNFAVISEMKEEYDKKRKYLHKALIDMGLTCFEPKGAFYVFPSVEKTKLSGEQFIEELLNKYKVCIPPGIAFGEAGYYHIRISYAYSMETIEKAMKFMKEFVDSLL